MLGDGQSNSLRERLWPHWRPEWLIHLDESVLVVNKPAGVPSLPDDESGHQDVRARLAAWRPELGGARLLHPLDREASGLMILARNKEASRALAAQLEAGVRRRYCVGVTTKPRASRLGAFQPCASADQTLDSASQRRLLELGSAARTQPIRRTLAHAGAPIAGDYDNLGPAAERLLLHVSELEISHPSDGATVVFRAPQPAAFERWRSADTALPTDPAELERRLLFAIDKRFGVGSRSDTDALRLVSCAGDGLTGVELDRYGDWALLSLRTAEALAAREPLLDAVAALGFEGVHLKLRQRKGELSTSEDPAPAQAQRGRDAPAPLQVNEHSRAFFVRLGDGMSTGIFLDQRSARGLVADCSAGKRVLNLFAYHGAFTVAAAAGGARQTVSVDSSGTALNRAQDNLQLHGVEAVLTAAGGAITEDGPAHLLVKTDANAWLRRCAVARPRYFDLVVLDPPSFSTTKRSRFRAAKDYWKLATSALRCLAKGGSLLACTNHRGIVQNKLRRQLTAAASHAGHEVQRMTALPDPIDFPPPPGQPCHLKSFWIEVA